MGEHLNRVGTVLLEYALVHVVVVHVIPVFASGDGDGHGVLGYLDGLTVQGDADFELVIAEFFDGDFAQVHVDRGLHVFALVGRSFNVNGGAETVQDELDLSGVAVAREVGNGCVHRVEIVGLGFIGDGGQVEVAVNDGNLECRALTSRESNREATEIKVRIRVGQANLGGLVVRGSLRYAFDRQLGLRRIDNELWFVHRVRLVASLIGASHTERVHAFGE